MLVIDIVLKMVWIGVGIKLLCGIKMDTYLKESDLNIRFTGKDKEKK